MSAGSVLVVGAATPLGRAVVRRFAFSGLKVAAADTCHGSVSKIAEENTSVGGKVQAFQVDVNKKEHRNELIQKVSEAFNGLDSLVIIPPENTAKGFIHQSTMIQFDRVMSQNLTTPFRLAQTAMPVLSKSKNGSIVFVSSTAGYQPAINLGLFSVASSGVLAMTRAIADSETARKGGIRVNSVVLGMVDGDGSGAIWDRKGEASNDEEGREIINVIRDAIPLRRLGRPSDAASLVEFLVSERARYITAENVVLSGGLGVRF